MGGGWFGWLGYRLGRRVERPPRGPAAAVPLPDFHLAYYDHLLRLDSRRNGGGWRRWSARAPTTRIARRLSEIRSVLSRPVSPEPYQPPDPLRMAPGGASITWRPCSVPERIHVGEIYQANICLRLEAGTRVGHELFARALDHVDPTYGATFATPWGGIASLSPELFLRREGRE